MASGRPKTSTTLRFGLHPCLEPGHGDPTSNGGRRIRQHGLTWTLAAQDHHVPAHHVRNPPTATGWTHTSLTSIDPTYSQLAGSLMTRP